VRLSARTEYACLAMLQLAKRYGSGEPEKIRRIAEEHGIPSRFLVQILLQLKSAGLVNSIRGSSGGYRLNLPPQEITLLEVIDVVEGNDQPTTSAVEKSPLSEVLLSLRQEISDQHRKKLSSVTLADIVEKAAEPSEPTWSI
jgi:Rrf2 family protein